MFRLIAVPVLLLVLFLFASCSDSSKQSSAGGGKSISGLVTDLGQVPLEGVFVSAYGKSTKTDAAGKFSFSADVPSDRAVVAFQKESYFDQSIGKKPSANGSTNLRVALAPRELAGSLDNAAGGKVATSKVRADFAPKSFVRTDGSEIPGTVRVFAAYLDPDDPGFGKAMPGGDFSAKDGAGDDGILTSFGALRIEAEEEASGESAQLKQKADICLRIPASMLASAPASMPVWRLNGSSAWEQTATAQRVGDEYCFFVTVLGAINCDIFSRSAVLTGKVCDGGSPARDAEVRVGQLSTQTDDKGQYAILVQSSVGLSLKTDFGSASAGPLAPASTSVVDVGCGGSDSGADVDDGDSDGGDPDSGDGGVPDAGSPTWTDPVTGLEWENTWPQPIKGQGAATQHCQGLGNGWKLPTIRELRSLIRGCPATACGASDSSCGACGMTDACVSASTNWACMTPECKGCASDKGPGAAGCYWPSEMNGECTVYFSSGTWYESGLFPMAPTVNFGAAQISYVDQSGALAGTANVRCVRTAP